MIVISFAKIGPPEKNGENNAFFCIIICLIFLYAQIRQKPFISEELNELNIKTSSILILTIFLGFYASFCDEPVAEMILILILLLFNCWINIHIIKNYIQMKIAFTKKSKFFLCVQWFFHKYWIKGKHFKI